MKLLRTIKSVLKNKLRERRENKYFQKLKQRTIALRKIKKSDIERWSQQEELLENWNERTAILAGKIEEGASVIEFGVGKLALKEFLPKNCKYQASDLISRSKDIIACDLNESIRFSLENYDTVVFSGVLEYVYDIEKVFRQFPDSIKIVILSYACSDISSAPRLERGWLSDYKKEELELIFKTNSYEISDYLEWNKQSIFHLIKK